MDGGRPLNEELRAAAVSLDAAALKEARLAFHRGHRARSARRVLYVSQLVAFALFAGAIMLAAATAPAITFNVIHFAALGLFAVAILWRLVAAGKLKDPLSRIAEPTHWPTYTILCPLYREANVVADLVAALNGIDYPTSALDIKLLVEADDMGTLGAAVIAAASAPHIEVVAIPPASPRTKPKALNAGLARGRGEYVVVYDAEDRPHPQQLRAALAAFEDGDEQLAGVQAPLAIDNGESWIARQFAAEYAIQFRELLPFLARLNLPLPLGGSSNHFRTSVLRAAGGWDPYNVTEDADLGYRLARDGYRIGVIGPPTWEEAPITLGAWLNQRTRWIKGHLQTWLVLMRDPVRTCREMGVRGFLAMQLMLGGGLIAAFAHGPLALVVLVAALSSYNLDAADFALALCGYCVALFAALTASALSNNLSHARAALTMPFYWPLSTIAAMKALFELIFRPHHWSKTGHGLSRREAHATPTVRHVEGLKRLRA